MADQFETLDRLRNTKRYDKSGALIDPGMPEDEYYEKVLRARKMKKEAEDFDAESRWEKTLSDNFQRKRLQEGKTWGDNDVMRYVAQERSKRDAARRGEPEPGSRMTGGGYSGTSMGAMGGNSYTDQTAKNNDQIAYYSSQLELQKKRREFEDQKLPTSVLGMRNFQEKLRKEVINSI